MPTPPEPDQWTQPNLPEKMPRTSKFNIDKDRVNRIEMKIQNRWEGYVEQQKIENKVKSRNDS